ncbi:MAG TPA: GNAT family N-acetyltransferase [Acidobacteria bacterium]|nr:GNAT family N-acetyltransferase [Acidobacteriota bacterium]
MIRSARPDDAPVIARLQILMARETEGLELDPDTVGRGVAAVFADPGRGGYVVAESDGRIAGCLLVTPEWSDWRNGTVLWIQSVYVLPEQRGRGVYRALWEHLRERVEASPDLHGLRLYVDKRNTAAQRVYTRLGMTREHYDLFEWLKE